MRNHRNLVGLAAVSTLFVIGFATTLSHACSRAVYLGPNQQIVTGRTMDWREDMQTNLWILPRGLENDGAMGAKGLKWTSKYGSVVATAYEAGSADGLNEKGLMANALFLATTRYPDHPNDERPQLSVSTLNQYLLDNFATVAEAVAEMKREAFRPVMVVAPNGAYATLHFSISDPTGDSAIFEYIDGKLVIHHGREYQVMTNEPYFDQQLVLNEYWKRVDGTIMLPGTNRADDRFVRASYYINRARQSDNPREAVAAVFSVMRNVSVPRGISTPMRPNISSTIWRTVADHKNLVYYFEDTSCPSLVWVSLADLDFTPDAGVRKLTLASDPNIAGNQTANFKPAKLFTYLAPN